ncbi:MAG: hypothetical protein IJ003_06185 [Candidatus Gastranaerophilales bacterium]|nr:hypothetical protein [Candidatus Gastranaerophilales bacterium]
MQQINPTQTTQEIFQKFPSANVYNNREYISNAINTDNIELQNSKKHKKRKTMKIVGATVAALGTAAIATITIIENLKHGKFIRKVLDGITTEGQKVAQNAKESVAVITENEKVKNIVGKIINISDNFTNIKDDLWDRLSSKLPFLKKLGQPFTNLYTNIYRGQAEKQYAKATEAMKEAFGEEILEKLPKFNEMFDGMSEAIDDALHGEGSQRISKGVFSFKNGIKGIFDKLTKQTLANVPIREKLNTEKYARLMLKNTIECTTQEQEKALKAFNNLVDGEMMPKLRDIIGGNAPTDMLGITGSLGALGIGIAGAEEKEEKKSIMTNLGIPLISTILSSLYATWKGISGGSAIVFGLATGKLGSIGANAVNKFRLKLKKNKEEKVKA